MNLDSAILAHYEWKNKFKTAIAHQSQLDAGTIGRDDCCEFGKWLHGDGGKLYGAKTAFTALLQKHKTFHVEAGNVASLINGRHFEEANAMLETASPFGAASLAVGVAASALKRVI